MKVSIRLLRLLADVSYCLRFAGLKSNLGFPVCNTAELGRGLGFIQCTRYAKAACGPASLCCSCCVGSRHPSGGLKGTVLSYLVAASSMQDAS